MGCNHSETTRGSSVSSKIVVCSGLIIPRDILALGKAAKIINSFGTGDRDGHEGDAELF